METNKNKGMEPTIFIINLNSPQPLGLILGKSNKSEAVRAIEKEGGKIINPDLRLQPPTSIMDVSGLNIEHLATSKFWFYMDVLFGVSYRFHVSLDKKEFFELITKLKSNYGDPIKYIAPPYFQGGLALWKYSDVEVELTAPLVSEMMCLEYRHVPTFREAAKEEKSMSYSSEKKVIKRDEKGL
ncbi:MAG: hypothetical protein ACHQYP_12335 [Nitrospiria bacterium]